MQSMQDYKLPLLPKTVSKESFEWLPYEPDPAKMEMKLEIASKSCLDASPLLSAQIGSQGFLKLIKLSIMADYSIQMSQNPTGASNHEVGDGPNSVLQKSRKLLQLKLEKPKLGRPLLQKMGAEIISTFILIFAGCGAVLVNAKTNGKVTDGGVALVFGLTVAAMVYSVGHISDCHMNPAVTIGFAVLKKCTLLEVPLFIISECLGAIVAMFLLKGILQPTNSEFVKSVTQPLETDIQSFFLEIFATFILMFVVSAISTDPRAQGQLAGIVVGSTVCALSNFAGPISGCSMNPARSLAPAIASGNYNALWLYIVGPPIGAVLAVFAYHFLRAPASEVEEKKGFSTSD